MSGSLGMSNPGPGASANLARRCAASASPRACWHQSFGSSEFALNNSWLRMGSLLRGKFPLHGLFPNIVGYQFPALMKSSPKDTKGSDSLPLPSFLPLQPWIQWKLWWKLLTWMGIIEMSPAANFLVDIEPLFFLYSFVINTFVDISLVTHWGEKHSEVLQATPGCCPIFAASSNIVLFPGAGSIKIRPKSSGTWPALLEFPFIYRKYGV